MSDHPAPEPREDRYVRQRQLPELGDEGHRRIRAARVTIVGCGALGSGSADPLVRSGIGQLTLIDADRLTEHNLQRVSVYREQDIGRPKVEALAEALRATNRDSEIRSMFDRLTPANTARLLAETDLVIDGLDNYTSRYALNDACITHRIPWVFGAVAGTFGMMMLIVPGASACLRCLFPEAPDPHSVLTAGTSGLLAPTPRLIASLQAASALRWIADPDPGQAGRLVFADCWNFSVFEQRVEINDNCILCRDL